MFAQEHALTWDTPLPQELQKEWQQIITDLVRVGEIPFPRSIRPRESRGRCTLVIFFDGSSKASAAVVYAIWMNESAKSAEVRLVTSKTKVAPDWEVNTPRMELTGALLGTRLGVKVCQALEDKPERLWFAGDSEIVLASREKHSAFFSEWFSNRIGELHENQRKIEEICPVGYEGEWWHVSSENNPADRPTRLDSKPEDLGLGSEWQTGIEYLGNPRELWPFERKFAAERKDQVKVPSEEVNKKYRGMIGSKAEISLISLDSNSCAVQMYKQTAKLKELGPEDEQNPVVEHFQGGYTTNDWEMLVRKTGLLFRWIVKVLKKQQAAVKVTEKDLAVLFWVKVAMPATRKAYEEKKLTKLSLWEHENMLVITGRAQEGLRYYFGTEYLPVLMSTTRTAELIMMWAHGQDHSNRDTTYTTANQVAWIVGGRRLAGKVKDSCVRCRFLQKNLLGQKMAPLPSHLTVPCPVFTNIGLDLMGPFTIRKVGSGKTTRGNQGTFKCWGLVILCLNTKALRLYAICGYSTLEFLLSYEQFTSDHGFPAYVHSDRGSQLVSAAKEVESPDYDWDRIVTATGSQTTWEFCPSGAQFRNGATEAFVKKVKRSLEHTYGNKNLNLQEFNTALKRVASILNARPIYAKMGPRGGVDPDFIQPITPNMLLLGRSNADIPLRIYEDNDAPLARLDYVSEVEALWWNQFKVQAFSSLVPTYRWREAQRNVCPGDVVLIFYTSKSKAGEYRLGRVVTVETDGDSLVRTCVVKYSLLQHLPEKQRLEYRGVTEKFIRVAVQRLVMILPVEEQRDLPAITAEEVEKAQAATENTSSKEVSMCTTEKQPLSKFDQRRIEVAKFEVKFMEKVRSNVKANSSPHADYVEKPLWVRNEEIETEF